MNRRVAPFYESVIKVQLSSGADRSLMFMLFLGCALLPYSWFGTTILKFILALAVAVPVFLFGRYWLRRMARKDPLLVRVWLRSLPYRLYYAAVAKFSALHAYRPRHWVKG